MLVFSHCVIITLQKLYYILFFLIFTYCGVLEQCHCQIIFKARELKKWNPRYSQHQKTPKESSHGEEVKVGGASSVSYSGTYVFLGYQKIQKTSALTDFSPLTTENTKINFIENKILRTIIHKPEKVDEKGVQISTLAGLLQMETN